MLFAFWIVEPQAQFLTGNWITANRIAIPAGSPSDAPGIIVSSVYATNYPNMPLPPGVWHTIDFHDGPIWGKWQPNLPPTSVGIMFSGILILTNPTPVVCDIQVTFRSVGSSLNSGNYQMQTLAIPGDGSRSNATATVALTDLKLEFFWRYTPQCAVWPAGTAINLTAQVVFWNAP